MIWTDERNARVCRRENARESGEQRGQGGSRREKLQVKEKIVKRGILC